jgi:lipoyl synthase
MNLKKIKEQLEVDIYKDMMEDLFTEDLDKLQEMAWKMRKQYFTNKIKFYLQPFEPVSVTGKECDLSCKHCNKHYLEHMHWLKNKKNIPKLFKLLAESNVNGVVLSGGSRKDGSVPTYDYASEVKSAKKKTGLLINAHTGIINKKQAEILTGFIDSALTDVIGDSETVKEILGLKYGPDDYKKTLQLLRKNGVRNLSPHIIVGLNHGKIKGELKALSILREVNPENIVIVVFIPTKGTAMAKDKPPKIDEVAKIIAIARIMYPDKNISLSCVRPGGKYRTELDKAAIKSGINKIAVPSKAAYKAAKDLELSINEIKESRCCAW